MNTDLLLKNVRERKDEKWPGKQRGRLGGSNRCIKLAGNRRGNARYLRDEPWMASTARNATGSPATALAATSFSTASLALTTAVYWSRVKFGAA